MSDLYHGTRAGYDKGGLVLPVDLHGKEARPGHQEGGTAYAYATTDWELAAWYALQAKGRGKARVLTVAPFGPVESDPSPYVGEEDQYRCAEGFVVVKVERIEP